MFVPTWLCAQQTPVYTQYLFNRAGVNPAASGSNINQKYNYVFGINRQWIGFDNPPRTNFANFSMTIRPARSYHYWQNVSVYIDTQEDGVLTNNGVYGGYAFHLLLRRDWTIAFGTYAGVRLHYLTTGSVDPNDPIFQKNNYRAILYPDLIPGLSLGNRKWFLDVSARQVALRRLQDFHGNSIGGPSQRKPTLFFSIGRRIQLNDFFRFVPSVALNSALVHYPDLSANAMLYYNKRVGAGLSLRNLNFLNFMVQLRILKTFAVGLAYSTSLNNARVVAPRGVEVMIGVVPVGMDDKGSGRHSIARCPALDF